MYTIFGYTADCKEFEFKFNSFVKAIKTFKELNRMNIVFFKRDKINSCMYINRFF